MKKLIKSCGFLVVALVLLGTSSRYLASINLPEPKEANPDNNGVNIYAALPEGSGEVAGAVIVADARPFILRNYLSYYDSELAPLSEYLVEAADQNGLDFRLLPAIAMQESTLCKFIPVDSYNCWGYGIYGDQVIRFDSYEDGIQAVARTLAEDYFADGLNTPMEIMKRYTPPSDGSWAYGVSLFLEIMEKGGIPNEQ